MASIRELFQHYLEINVGNVTNVYCGNCLDILISKLTFYIVALIGRSLISNCPALYNPYSLISDLFFSFSSMPICALYRSTIRRSSWSPMGSCRCVSACIERPVPRTLSCLPTTINLVICARSFSVTSPAIYPVLWCRWKISRKCCNLRRCLCRNPLAKCWKVRLSLSCVYLMYK